MRWRFFVAFQLLFFSTCMAGPIRTEEPFNREWRFLLGDASGAELDGYNDSAWQRVGLPHTFSLPYFGSKDFYTGYGWYRKRFALTRKDLKRNVSIEFDGVFQQAEVFVNGHRAGGHVGGYTGFTIDITPYIIFGDNVIAVRVNNLWQPTVAPRGGEHTFSGGIYRGVRLVKKSPVHVAWNGLFVTTPDLEQNGGKSSAVNVTVELVNTSASLADMRVVVAVEDSIGRIVAEAGSTRKMAARSADIVTLTTPQVESPMLWSPQTPDLYRLKVRLYDGKKLCDEASVDFGFRWFRWDKDHGFFLNGSRYFFHGANVHQDHAGWGDAVTEEAARRDVRMIREAGFDMIRGSHYPHSPAFVDECDRQGILFWSEAPFWGTAGEKRDGSWTAGAYPGKPEHEAAFEENALQQLEEMIRIHRNHPSVFVWSMCNEPFFTEGHTLKGVHRLLARMVERTHQLDPTRKAAIGGAQRPLGQDRIDLIGDVAGYNGDGANIADFQHPDVPNVVSEYGSTFADRPGRYIPGWGDLGRDEGWRGREWRAGQAIWCGFDHGSIFGEAMGKLGIVDYFRIPKRSWYWYRNEYRHIVPPQWPAEGTPARVVVTATRTDGVRADGTDDVQLTVTIVDAAGRHVTDSPDVTLRIVSGPGEFPTGRSITFSSKSDIRILDGQAAMTLRAYESGITVVEAVSDGLQPSTVSIRFTDAPAYKEGRTPVVDARPYVRYVVQTGGNMQKFGQDNPVFVSTSVSGHAAGLAADGKGDTYWQPLSGDARPMITLDTERGVRAAEIRVKAGGDIRDLRMELSDDNERWTLYDNVETTAGGYRLKLSPAVNMRYVRLTFAPSDDIRVYEMEVRGRIATDSAK
ncbi:glycoside hydrolase family 2 protein [Xylanibacter rodentium]|nr:glycoside hydrolase family 2 TIM barrel-domain containing protein [Xylanibacter rodentium]